MAAIIRALFKSKKTRKADEKDDDCVVFQPCIRSSSTKRQPTARFADDCMLPATAAYHTKSAPKLRKGPQSCPGGNRDESIDDDDIPENLMKKSGIRRPGRQEFRIDSDFEQQGRRHHSRPNLKHREESSSMKHGKIQHSLYDLRYEDDENDEYVDREQIARSERNSNYYMQKYEDSERQRREEKRKQDRLEQERNNIQNAMSNMAYCMASVQQLEQLKKERDQYKKEMSRYKTKCEKLEKNRAFGQQLTPNYGAFPPFHSQMQPSPYHTPQFAPPPPVNYQNTISHPNPQHNQPLLSMDFMSNGPLSTLHRSVDFLNGPQSSQYPPPNFINPGHPSSNHGSTGSYTMTNTPTTIRSDGAGEALVNMSDVTFLRNAPGKVPTNFYDADDNDHDEIKNFRNDDAFLAPSPLSVSTQSTARTNDEH